MSPVEGTTINNACGRFLQSDCFIALSSHRPMGSTNDYYTSLPSPDRHSNSIHTGCSCGSVPPPSGERFSSYQLHVFKFHKGILACVVDNLSPISEDFQVFFIFRSYFLTNSFLVLPWLSNDLENFVKNMLHLAIDQHPVCPNRARRELWPRKWFRLGRNPWHLSCRSTQPWSYARIQTGGFLLFSGGPKCAWAKPKLFCRGSGGMLPRKMFGKVEPSPALSCILAVKTDWLQYNPLTKSTPWVRGCAGEDLYWFDRINWPLTSRDVYSLGNACIGRVCKQFQCLRLSKEASWAPPRLAALVVKTYLESKILPQISHRQRTAYPEWRLCTYAVLYGKLPPSQLFCGKSWVASQDHSLNFGL